MSSFSSTWLFAFDGLSLHSLLLCGSVLAVPQQQRCPAGCSSAATWWRGHSKQRICRPNEPVRHWKINLWQVICNGTTCQCVTAPLPHHMLKPLGFSWASVTGWVWSSSVSKPSPSDVGRQPQPQHFMWARSLPWVVLWSRKLFASPCTLLLLQHIIAAPPSLSLPCGGLGRSRNMEPSDCAAIQLSLR